MANPTPEHGGIVTRTWLVTEVAPPLARDTVHIWRIPVAAGSRLLPRLASLLSAAELEEIARFRFADDRDRRTLARASLRSVLGTYLGEAPERLAIERLPSGKPALGGSDLEFNVSHSGGMVLIAAARGCPVGVDVEQWRPRYDPLALARRFFARSEAAQLAALPSADVDAGFFTCWTRKEALVKMTGHGLRTPLGSFSVWPPPSPACVTPVYADGRSDASRICDLDPAAGYSAAVATARPLEVHRFELVFARP